MLLTDACKPAIVSLQSLPGNKTPKGIDKTIPQSLVFYIPESEPPVKIQTTLALLEIFKIKFNFLTQIHHTKVMKVNYGNNNAIYKVVLFSILSPGASICWLEHLFQGWIMLLGNNIGEGLKEAITSAIEYQEELA
ncbi:hypothetical protein [Mucilaginibacter flavidus]|uniref:hypothetical protein n=1 Tax=Mucilaginibacter flavidus TaxID=2949309 RepID=UPI002092DA56|nr:hypothetical protein [Mucilaginibacter flavidus]MCO5946782.1 hypothetical protein [Mucilaginibacter flavidus]